LEFQGNGSIASDLIVDVIDLNGKVIVGDIDGRVVGLAKDRL
jgi:hypothetical protein